ncbi:MAG TPA: oligopeptide/dipeptide ABC transporter ATP-binding protein, partial [Actinomycetota bacterium]|nr:oligopeptide/dipeptide ABC transporter ATP-binding protein [Actinomycetota bacterium]
TVFRGPNHPYTEALLSAVPNVDGTQGARILLEGEIPSPANPPTGCVFHTRCHRMIQGLCEVTEPPLIEVEPGHRMSCHIPLEELRVLQRKAVQEAAEGVTLTSVAPALEAEEGAEEAAELAARVHDAATTHGGIISGPSEVTDIPVPRERDPD